MPQAVHVVGKAEQQGLADLGGQAASGCARGEFAFDGGEDAFDLGALPIRFLRKGAEHLIANSAVRDTPALAEPAAPTKSAAAHPRQSTTSTKDDEAWARAHVAPDAGERRC